MAITLPIRPAMSINQYTLCVSWAMWTDKADFSQEVKQRMEIRRKAGPKPQVSHFQKKQLNEAHQGVRVGVGGPSP
jgi:hypothetical protein